MDANFARDLRVTARKHDVICCPVSDPRETELAGAGLLEIQDPESGQLLLLDTGSSAVRRHFREQAEQDRLQLRDMLRKLKIDTILLSTDRPFLNEVRKLFRQRQIRAGRG
jgi:uncharacterized protein (DUF58 family)